MLLLQRHPLVCLLSTAAENGEPGKDGDGGSGGGLVGVSMVETLVKKVESGAERPWTRVAAIKVLAQTAAGLATQRTPLSRAPYLAALEPWAKLCMPATRCESKHSRH